MINNFEDLSHILSTSIIQIKNIEYNKWRFYKSFNLTKKSGERTIDAPDHHLKPIQRHILDRLLYKFEVHKSAHGFVKEKSIISNSYNHIKKRVIFKIDISDFFPSITSERVSKLFNQLGFSGFASYHLTELTTYNGRLPQGAPTSPYIANLICKKLDTRLSGVAKKYQLRYSRYADDIIFSGDVINKLIIGLIKKIIREEGFDINDKKTRVMSKGTRQVVTGLIVNEKLGIGRKNYRTLRVLVDKSIKFDLCVLKEYLLGKIALLKNIDIVKWTKLKNKILKLKWSKNRLKLIWNKKISFDILSTMKDIENYTRQTVFICDKEKAENLFVKCSNEDEFNSRIQTLFRFISEMNIDYFKKFLTAKEIERRKHIGIVEAYLVKNNLDSVFIDVWKDIQILSAKIKRHKADEELIKVFEKYNEYPKINYNGLWIKILENFGKSLLQLINIIELTSSK